MIFYTEEVRYDVPASGLRPAYYWKSRWKIVIEDNEFSDVKIYIETIHEKDLTWQIEEQYFLSQRIECLRLPKKLVASIGKIFTKYEKVKVLK